MGWYTLMNKEYELADVEISDIKDYQISWKLS